MTGINQTGHVNGTNRLNDRRCGLPDWLHLAATPAFALMALLTAVPGSARMTCIRMAGSSPLDSMGFMYLLMAVFHATPWMKAGKSIFVRSGQESSR